jgi:hypothetical protein
MNAFGDNRLYSFDDLSYVIYEMPKGERAHKSKLKSDPYGDAHAVRRPVTDIKNDKKDIPLEIKVLAETALKRGGATRKDFECIFEYFPRPLGKNSYKVLCWDKAPERPVEPLFKLLLENTEPVVETEQAAAKTATRSNRRAKKFSFSSKTKEEIWEIIDQRILECASHPVTAKVLYKKARTSGPDRKRFQEYVVPRRDLLLAQGRLHTWKERKATYYCVTPPPDEPEPSPAVVEAKSINPPVIVAEIVEPPVKVAAEVVDLPIEEEFEQDQRSDLEIKVDERILRACACPITSTILRNKVRGKYGDEARDLYLVRTEYLIQQEKLYTWKDRRVTYYCVTPPPDEPKPAPAVVEAEVEVVEVAQESPGALVPTAQALTNAETLQDVLEHGVRQRFYETFQEDKNQELFEGALLACARGIGRQFEWVMFEGKKWLTVKQLASLLSLEEDSVLWWFRGCPVQEAVLTERLTGDRLKNYKSIYNPLTPLTPPDVGEYYSPTSRRVEGLFDKTVHSKAHHLLLFNPAGASWIALAARTEPAELIKSSFWVALAEIANVLKGQIQTSGSSLQTSDPVAWEMLVNIHRDVQIVKDRLDNNVVPTTTRTEEIVNRIDINTNSPRKEFLPDAISSAIEAFLYITLNTGRDVIDQTLLINANGSKTKDCEFDHIRSRSVRSAENCMPLSKVTHRKKTYGQLTPEEKATLERAEKAIENYWAQKSQIKPHQPSIFGDLAV